MGLSGKRAAQDNILSFENLLCNLSSFSCQGRSNPFNRPEMKYSIQELNEVLLAATPTQLAELKAISEVFNISMNEVCGEVLKLINAKFPLPEFVFSKN
jgi:hypothetical protein